MLEYFKECTLSQTSMWALFIICLDVSGSLCTILMPYKCDYMPVPSHETHQDSRRYHHDFATCTTCTVEERAIGLLDDSETHMEILAYCSWAYLFVAQLAEDSRPAQLLFTYSKTSIASLTDLAETPIESAIGSSMQIATLVAIMAALIWFARTWLCWNIAIAWLALHPLKPSLP